MDEIEALAPAVNVPVWNARKAFYSLVAFFVPQIVLGASVGIAKVIGAKAGTQFPEYWSAVMLIVSSFVGLILGGLIVFRDVRRCFPGPIAAGALLAIGWVRPRARDLGIASAVGVGFAVLYLTALVVFPPQPEQRWGPMSKLLASGGWALHSWAVGAVLVSPIVEEFMFRGILLKGFSNSWGVWVGAPLVTVIFVSIHLTEVAHHLPALIVLTACAIASLVARLATRSLVPSIVIHASYNLGLVVTVYASRAMMH